MSEFDREEDAILDRARRALTPSAVVTKRMRAALLAKVAAPVAAAAAGGVATSATAAGTSAQLVEGVSGSALAGGGALASGAKLAASSASALATGAKVAMSAALLKVAAGVTTAAMLATAGGYYWSARQEAPLALAPAPGVAPASATGKRAAPAQPARGGAPQPAPRSEATRSQPPQSPAIAGSESTPAILAPQAAPGAGSQQLLQGELDVLKRVRQALQVGDAGRALSLLAELDAQQPVSPLWQEREVARVLALCGAGRVTAAREAAQRLLGPNPNSLYAERIRASCAATHSAARVPANASANRPAESKDDSVKSTKVAPPVARFGDSGN